MALGKLNLKLGIDVSNLEKELGKVERSMARFGGKMQSVGTTLSQSLTLPIIALGGAALKSFADMERLELGLTAIMGSSKAAEEELQKLRKTAENPGLALPQVVQASSTLQAVGLSADAARETILQFGNATARAGKGAVVFDELIFAFSKIQSTGKITQESINQIAERLPGFSTLLQQTFGASTAEGINATGISAEDFSKKTVEALSNLQRAQGGLGNSFDNLTDNITASLAELGKVINTSLNVDAIFIALSDKLNYLVQGFKKLNPETQGFIVYAGLIVAAIGPAIFIVGKMITTFGALAGTTKMIIETFGKLKGAIIKAFTTILANPAILGITLAIAAIGAVALYVYDNWEAFASRFTNIWINIKNSANKGVADFMMAIDKLQKSFGVKLFDVSGLTSYTAEQKVVQKEFKSIGETVDSLSGKLKGLFLAKPISGKTDETIIDKTKTDTVGGTGAAIKIDKSLFAFDSFKTLNELQKAKEELDKAVLTDVAPKLREQLGITEGGLISMKNAANDVLALGERLKNNPPEMAKPFSDADAAAFKLEERVNRLADSFEILNVGLQNIVDGTLNDLAIGFGDELGKALSGAGFSISSLITPMADALAQFGKLAIQTGITAAGIKLALKPPINPALAIAGGVALVALSKLVKSKVPALAEGGLATGPTMALVGDNRNARVDPEVIAPLSKLKGMLDGGGSPYVLSTRVSGADLIVIMEKARNVNTRIR
jgi:tape measure domain-containing protein